MIDMLKQGTVVLCNTRAAMTIIRYFAGVIFTHNFLLATSPAGLGTLGPVAVSIGLVFYARQDSKQEKR